MLHTKSQGHWPFVPENKIFKGFLTYMGAVALTLKLIYSHCLIRFHISSENNDWLQQYSKNHFFQKNHIKMQSEANLTLMLSRSRSTEDHHLNKLGRPNIQNVTY